MYSSPSTMYSWWLWMHDNDYIFIWKNAHFPLFSLPHVQGKALNIKQLGVWVEVIWFQISQNNNYGIILGNAVIMSLYSQLDVTFKFVPDVSPPISARHFSMCRNRFSQYCLTLTIYACINKVTLQYYFYFFISLDSSECCREQSLNTIWGE